VLQRRGERVPETKTRETVAATSGGEGGASGGGAYPGPTPQREHDDPAGGEGSRVRVCATLAAQVDTSGRERAADGWLPGAAVPRCTEGQCRVYCRVR
jgi:hypothetical protein